MGAQKRLCMLPAEPGAKVKTHVEHVEGVVEGQHAAVVALLCDEFLGGMFGVGGACWQGHVEASTEHKGHAHADGAAALVGTLARGWLALDLHDTKDAARRGD